MCGWDDGDIRWNTFGLAEYVICDCCGTESGNGDQHLSAVRATRQRWVDAGCPWWWKRPPEGWEPVEQLRQVPPGWR